MLATFPVPILSVTADAVRELQGQDALYGLWTVFTKCKESVQDGRRLENISWRLWYRERAHSQASSPDSPTPHPMDDRFRSSYFPAPPPNPQLPLSGLPSPSDQPSPSPLPPTMSAMIPPSTPERPRISPHSTSPTITRGKSTICVGRLIVDMLPNHLSLPQPKPSSLAIPPPMFLPSHPCNPNVPLVQLPTCPEAPFPRVVVVNPTPHPTPPTTPILHDDTPGAPQPPSTFLLPPLPPPALRPAVPSAETHAQQKSQQPCALIPREPSLLPTPARITDVGSLTRQSDRRFFLPHSPEDASPERGDGSTASGKSPSDLFEASSTASSQVKSVLTDVDDDKKEDDQEEEVGEEDDRRSTTAAAGPGERHSAQARQNKPPKKAKEAAKRPLVKRSHSAKHVAPSMVRKLSALQQQHPQPERTDKKGATFNIGSGSSNGSRSANGSTGKGHARASSLLNGFTAIQPSKVSPPQSHPPVIPNGFTNGRVVPGNPVPNCNANINGNMKPNANGNAIANPQSRKTIVVANTSSEEYETTDDGEDSEAWASEDMDAEDKARQVEESRLREAALEAQRQRDLFAKVPKRSYSNLNRTQSGLLSQLMNPNPAIFPPNHPYRVTRSSADISHQYQQLQQRAPVPQRSTSAYAPPRLSTSKSAAALPLAAQITAVSSSRAPSSSAAKRQESEKNGYRPKGPPKEQEMEDESGDDADDRIQMSQSVAQQKLQALMSRRGSQQGTSSHLIQPVAMEGGPGLLSSTTAPIPFGHPYNLPAAAPPMTPRTTRRRMLKTELSESMRRQLLWERQVSSNTNPALVARRANQGLSGLRPLTSNSSEGIRDAPTEVQDKEERRRRAMARNRSWADDYHYSGW